MVPKFFLIIKRQIFHYRLNMKQSNMLADTSCRWNAIGKLIIISVIATVKASRCGLTHCQEGKVSAMNLEKQRLLPINLGRVKKVILLQSHLQSTVRLFHSWKPWMSEQIHTKARVYKGDNEIVEDLVFDSVVALTPLKCCGWIIL